MTNEVQHKATITVAGRRIELHAPPFASVKQLEAWIAETLRNLEAKLVSKSWGASQ